MRSAPNISTNTDHTAGCWILSEVLSSTHHERCAVIGVLSRTQHVNQRINGIVGVLSYATDTCWSHSVPSHLGCKRQLVQLMLGPHLMMFCNTL